MLLDWPVAQQTLGALPWVASIWVDEPWKFLLWALGIAIDIVVIVAFSPSSTLERISRLEDELTTRAATFRRTTWAVSASTPLISASGSASS